MKFLKNTLFWALLAIAGLAQDASAGRFIVWGNVIQPFTSQPLFNGMPAETQFKLAVDDLTGDIYWSGSGAWEKSTGCVIDIEDINDPEALKKLAYDQNWTTKWSVSTLWQQVFWPDRLAAHKGKLVDTKREKMEAVPLRLTGGSGEEFPRRYFERYAQSYAQNHRDLEIENLLKEKGLLVDYVSLTEWHVKNTLSQERIAELIEALGAVPAAQQTEKSKQKLAWLRAATKPAEDPDSEGDDEESVPDDETEDGKEPKGDKNPADPKGKPKPKDEPKSLYSRFMSVHAGYRYGGAHVAFILAASMLQVMYEGYCGVGFEAKDLAELSVLKKVLRAFNVSLSPARHAANAKALFRVLRPQVQKGVVTPKILARAKQFAKDKPLVLAGLLSLIAVDVYGVCVHADDIKAFVQGLRN